MLLFIDNATTHTGEYILKYKSEAMEKFKECNTIREKKSGKQVKRFRTDGGGEYTSKNLADYLQSEGILKETTMPFTPQSIGVVEQANHTIMSVLMMHARRCRNFEEVLGICSLSGSLSQESHSDAIGSG